MNDQPLHDRWIIVRQSDINVTRRHASLEAAEEHAKFFAKLTHTSYAILHHVKTV